MHSAGGKGLVKVWLTLGGGRSRQDVSASALDGTPSHTFISIKID